MHKYKDYNSYQNAHKNQIKTTILKRKFRKKNRQHSRLDPPQTPTAKTILTNCKSIANDNCVFDDSDRDRTTQRTDRLPTDDWKAAARSRSRDDGHHYAGHPAFPRAEGFPSLGIPRGDEEVRDVNNQQSGRALVYENGLARDQLKSSDLLRSECFIDNWIVVRKCVVWLSEMQIGVWKFGQFRRRMYFSKSLYKISVWSLWIFLDLIFHIVQLFCRWWIRCLFVYRKFSKICFLTILFFIK